MKFCERRLASTVLFLLVLFSLLVPVRTTHASPVMLPGAYAPTDTYTLQFSSVDDVMHAYIMNATYTAKTLMFSRGFAPAWDPVDISSFVATGPNTITLEVVNTCCENVAGWTYAYDLRVNGNSVASETCGIWNSVGCQNDLSVGTVWTRDIALHVATPVAVPEPSSILLFGVGSAAAVAIRRRKMKAGE